MAHFSRIIAITLLTAMVGAGAGAACLLPASAAPSHSSGCHPRVPSNPQPADYRCCASRHASALITNVFSPCPTLQPLEADAVDVFGAASDNDAFPTAFAPSGGPPAITTLRI